MKSNQNINSQIDDRTGTTLEVVLQHLIMLTNQKSFRMPSGLTREERRAWAKSNRTR